jgi:hypothetical protein
MIDFCPKCRKRRLWKCQRNRHGFPIFRRTARRGVPGFCVHAAPNVKHVSFPPDGVL